MITKYTHLRMMILATLPCLGNYPSLSNAEIPIIRAKSVSSISPADQEQVLLPTLVGVVINGRELDSIDVLYDSGVDDKLNNKNDHYFLSVDDLSRLTKVRLLPIPTNNTDSMDTVNNTYEVSTPIGDTTLTANQVVSYQGQKYLSLSTLKKLGITADYSQPDLAIQLNMGWRPSKISTVPDHRAEQDLPIDYHPSRAGLLGLSFNSSLSTSESNGGQNSESSTSRQMYTDIGAYGYALGGVWGINAVGYDSSSSNSTKDNNKGRLRDDVSFAKNALNGFTYLPSDWDTWQVNNLYWARTGEHIATRLGINQPNSLGQGALTSGAEFTGAMVAYSNRNIARHLSYFDDDSRSLLQNTSQDYQHLTGIGEAGGIAELRISGQPIARVQIGLDGRYEFLNLDVSQLSLTDTLVEIAIYAYPLARQPLEIRPIILGKRRTNAATDELLIEAGIGRSGNLINHNSRYINKNSDTAAHLYAEYGINNRLAVRGGLNTNIQSLPEDNNSVSWHAGANYSISPYINADISYATMPTQDFWQAQLQYQRKKLWANYQYQSRQYHSTALDDSSLGNDASKQMHDQQHQLLLNYSPSNRTNISFNQYYEDMAINTTGADNYYAYASINHRFNDALNASANWSSNDDRYGYRLTWQDIYRGFISNNETRNTIGLSGDNDGDTLSLQHQLNNSTSLGQSVSRLHESNKLLYQGDMSYRFNTRSMFNRNLDNRLMGNASADSLISVGYSLYNNHVGWLADWQLTNRKGVNFSLGYKHRYVDAIPSSRYDDLLIGNALIEDGALPAWTQNNYLYASLSFDMFKPPKQRLQIGNYPRQREGSVIVDIEHPADTPIDYENMRFELDKQQVKASLLGTQSNHSQYLISNIKAGDYTLTMDGENLPLEYSTGELQTPRIRVSNYAPTSVPIQLEKTYGVSGKLATAEKGVKIDIYQGDTLIQSITTGSYGYYQIFGLSPGTYTVQAKGYEAKKVDITNDFVMQVMLQPTPYKATQ